MSVEAQDLPRPVRRALEEWADLPPSQVASGLRLEASRRVTAACGLWAVREWPATIEQLAVAQGYLVAALRVEEGE